MKQKLFLFISFSSQVRVHFRPVDGFFYARQLKRCEITQGCAFGGLNDFPRNYGGKTPQKTEILGA